MDEMPVDEPWVEETSEDTSLAEAVEETTVEEDSSLDVITVDDKTPVEEAPAEDEMSVTEEASETEIPVEEEASVIDISVVYADETETEVLETSPDWELLGTVDEPSSDSEAGIDELGPGVWLGCPERVDEMIVDPSAVEDSVVEQLSLYEVGTELGIADESVGVEYSPFDDDEPPVEVEESDVVERLLLIDTVTVELCTKDSEAELTV